ncbi:MAG TPA: ATP-binding protein, partial [Gammaproteobacteria bacterium]|nr:ATP-binding protein [Gammaproteobacteria bacterium]
MRQFIGRKSLLQAFENRLDLDEGRVLRYIGAPGIGKSALLREFRKRCESRKRPYLWLNLENAAELPSGQEILFELGRSAHGFPAARRAALRQPDEGAGDALNRYDNTFDKLADAAKLADPGGGALIALGRAAVQLAQNLLGPRAGDDIDSAIANSERYLLQTLAAAPGAEGGCRHPVAFFDTYEHLLSGDQRFISRVEFDGGDAREGIQRQIHAAQWMRELGEFLVANGWIVVIAGRYLVNERDAERLPHLDRNEIAEALEANPAFTDWLPARREPLLDLLGQLSFGGNPLWLSIAMNLLERQLTDGDTPERLQADPDYLRQCFEQPGPDDTLAALEGIEHSACKLHLLQRLNRDNPELEAHGWRIALPRVLDNGILRCLYPREQAEQLLTHYRRAGAFDEANRHRFRLHEEIRDLLLAYARAKGYLETQETRGLHCRILQYLFEQHDFDPDAPEYQDDDAPWLLEAAYHAVQVKSELRRHGVRREAFWNHLGGSASLPASKKLRIAIQPHDQWQIQGLIAVLEKETDGWNRMFGPTTTEALSQALRDGSAKNINDLGFWRQRVAEVGLAGDYYGLAQILDTFDDKEDAIAAYNALLTRFVDSDAPEIQVRCAMALLNKGITLGRLQRSDEEIAACDELLARFGDRDDPEIQRQCAMALVNKGVTLGRSQRPDEEIAVYDALLARLGDSDDPEIQCYALLYKGVALSQMQRPNEAIAAY